MGPEITLDTGDREEYKHRMNIYLVERLDGQEALSRGEYVVGYDEHDSFVCVAASEDDARAMTSGLSWPTKDVRSLVVTSVGTAPAGSYPHRVLASFNAG